MVPRKLQKTDNLCGFYAINSAFLLFKFFQKILKNVHDVHVLNFISSFYVKLQFLFVRVTFCSNFTVECSELFDYLCNLTLQIPYFFMKSILATNVLMKYGER